MLAVADNDREIKTRNVENRLAKQAAKDKPLDSRQKKAVELLCAGLAPKCVADSLGIGKTALDSWRRKPAFKVAIAEGMSLDADLHGARLQNLFGKAVERVSELLDDPSPHIRVQAARLAFDGQDIWVTSAHGGVVSTFTKGGHFVRAYNIGGSPRGIAFDGSYIWVAKNDTESIVRIFVR